MEHDVFNEVQKLVLELSVLVMAFGLAVSYRLVCIYI